MSQYLVLLSSNEQGAAAAVRQRCHVVSALPPRLLVVEADEQVAQELRVLPGVDDVISEMNNSLPNSLNESELLFAQAWQQSRHLNDKSRPGEGLNWDAEGFLPPDHPDPAQR
jgi:hypothetical protein